VVYITEAHPTDVWQMRSNIRDNVLFASPTNEDQRAEVAGTCVRKLGIQFPAVLDEFGNSTERAYTGWPDRLYLVDAGGHIVYKSKPGPFGFKPEQLEAALARTVTASSPAASASGMLPILIGRLALTPAAAPACSSRHC